MPDVYAIESPNSADIYKYTVEIKIFINDGAEIFTVNQYNIHSLLINYEYVNLNMPICFLTAAIDKAVIDKMIKFIDKSLISMTVSKYIANSDMPGVTVASITGQFIYFIGDDYNKNNDQDYIEQNKEREDIFKVITIGLIKLDHINNNKKTFQGVVNGTDTSSMIYYCCGNLPLVLEPITYNKSINSLMFPMLQSVSKAIDYLNTHVHAFYDTMYRFYMDFDSTYLVSSSGKPIPKKGDKINSIIINIYNKSDKLSNIQGMNTDTKQKVYIVNTDKNNCEPIENTTTGSSFTTLSGANSDGKTGSQAVSTHVNSKISAKDRLIRVPDGNDTLLKNKLSEIKNASTGFMIMLTDVDRDIFTINNKISIKCTEAFPGRDGTYIMIQRKEIYTREQNHMTLSTTLNLNKIAQ